MQQNSENFSYAKTTNSPVPGVTSIIMSHSCRDDHVNYVTLNIV